MSQVWNLGTCSQQQKLSIVGEEESKSSNTSTIMSRFESPTSAFYATENYMGFAEFDNQSLSSQLYKINDFDFPLYQSLRENNHFLDSSNQHDPNFELSNTLQALVKSQLNGNQCLRFQEKSNKFSCENFPGSKFIPIEQQKLFLGGLASVGSSSSFCNKGNQSYMVSGFVKMNLLRSHLPLQQHNDRECCQSDGGTGENCDLCHIDRLCLAIAFAK